MSSLSVLPNYSLVPPYMLKEIIDNGDSNQQITASLTLIDVNRILSTDPLEPEPVMAEVLATKGKVYRSIYDAHNKESLPGTLIRREGGTAINDIAAKEAYDYLGVTYAFFWQKFQRHSLDNKGLQLDASIHYSNNYQNAFWNGQRMVFGDGDGQIFNRFTIAIDVIAHELTHGVTESEAGFIYYGQAGALNESMSDVFGSMVKQFHKNQTAAEADWLIGEGLLNSKINAKGLRSMAAPGTAYDDPLLGKDPQPGHMNHYLNTRNDNGGVHSNSGIPNRAFYLAATKLGGYSWEKAGKIWYDALCDESLKEKTGSEHGYINFLEFSRLTIDKARLFDTHTAEQVRDAWHEVGVW